MIIYSDWKNIILLLFHLYIRDIVERLKWIKKSNIESCAVVVGHIR